MTTTTTMMMMIITKILSEVGYKRIGSYRFRPDMA